MAKTATTRKGADQEKGSTAKRQKIMRNKGDGPANTGNDENRNKSGRREMVSATQYDNRISQHDSDNDNSDTDMETEQPEMAFNLDRLEKMLTDKLDSMFKTKMREMVEKQQVAEEETTKDSEKMKAQGYLNKPEDLRDGKNIAKMEE